jgi:hypothetical protein
MLFQFASGWSEFPAGLTIPWYLTFDYVNLTQSKEIFIYLPYFFSGDGDAGHLIKNIGYSLSKAYYIKDHS